MAGKIDDAVGAAKSKVDDAIKKVKSKADDLCKTTNCFIVGTQGVMRIEYPFQGVASMSSPEAAIIVEAEGWGHMMNCLRRAHFH